MSRYSFIGRNMLSVRKTIDYVISEDPNILVIGPGVFDAFEISAIAKERYHNYSILALEKEGDIVRMAERLRNGEKVKVDELVSLISDSDRINLDVKNTLDPNCISGINHYFDLIDGYRVLSKDIRDKISYRQGDIINFSSNDFDYIFEGHVLTNLNGIEIDDSKAYDNIKLSLRNTGIVGSSTSLAHSWQRLIPQYERVGLRILEYFIEAVRCDDENVIGGVTTAATIEDNPTHSKLKHNFDGVVKEVYKDLNTITGSSDIVYDIIDYKNFSHYCTEINREGGLIIYALSRSYGYKHLMDCISIPRDVVKKLLQHRSEFRFSTFIETV